MATVLRARDEAENWACATLCLARGVELDVSRILEVVPWIEAAAAELAVLPPLGLLADVGRILQEGPFDLSLSQSLGHPKLRRALLDYEEQLLGRLLADRRIDAARDAFARLPVDVRPSALAIFASQIIGRLADDARVSASAAVVRHVVRQPPADILERGARALRVDDELLEELAASYSALADASRRHGALFGAAEVFVLENQHALRGAAHRLALSQIAEATEVLESRLPRRARRSRSRAGHTATRIESESQYPIGGYASISTSGPLENLVSSELVYMDSGAAVNLFDLRWASGELLKYTRDESVHARGQRRFTFAIAPDLERARIKDPEVPWQRLVMLLAVLIATTRRLLRWLDDSNVCIVLSFCRPPDEASPLAPEAALCRLLLREWIESGKVEVEDTQTVAACLEATELARARTGVQSDLVWVGANQAAVVQPDRGAETTELHRVGVVVDGPVPRLVTQAVQAVAPLPEGSPGLDAWSKLTISLLDALV
jgi:hypothetical protein